MQKTVIIKPKKNPPSFTAVGIPPTKIFFVLKSLEPIDPFGIVRLISTYTWGPKTTPNTNRPCQQLNSTKRKIIA
jgi:hypothetical protein